MIGAGLTTLAALIGALLGAMIPYWPLWLLVLAGLLVWHYRGRAS